ncbi:DNA topoisomerase I [Achromatium sp. WMS2]|nr:DNA topoisomerase I [Achromatium sp. WMS2]
MHLVVVESPAKAKTIKKYLGSDFEVLASYGHVRDLIPKAGAVDPDDAFRMNYQEIERNARHVQAIIKKLKDAQSLYLATDPDREGEAIAWHLYELLNGQKLLSDKQVHRVAFHEITQKAVQEAINNPRTLSTALINAQQARRALDYLVGFNLSPLLWKKVRQGLSAGRVQSPALRLIVEREQEINAFKTREYWTIEADTTRDDQAFIAKLTHLDQKRLSQFSITTSAQAEAAKNTVLTAAQGYLTVVKIERKQRKRQPAAPFTTSTLQQEAARKLSFTTKRTMQIAQQLYEGIEIGSDAVGLITYMRTDSVVLAQDAVTEIRNFISQRYGPKEIPSKPNVFKTKAKNAQEAHEAIRPTSALRTPADVAPHLTKDQLKLYELIWKRTIASQMNPAILSIVTVDFSAGSDNTLRSNGSTVANPGFMQVYLEGQDDATDNDTETMLPALNSGDKLPLNDLRTLQHFTEPPPRYTEASLVRTLEEHGIGRPSTYASIISTLQEREYAKLESKRFIPTDVGDVVNKFLTQHFTQYVDYAFTAKLEDDLDAISRGETEWIPLLSQFWDPFKSQINLTDSNVSRSEVTQEATEELCPKCGKTLSKRLGRRGRFIGCTGYPSCDYTRNLDKDAQPEVELPPVGRDCPQCGAPLITKQGRYNNFIGCSGYPKCKYLEPLEKPKDSGVVCPQCNGGNLLERKSRGGRVFYSCATYPKCKYAVNKQPIAEPCPKCNWPILTLGFNKRKGIEEKACPQKGCGFKVEVTSSN